MPVWESSVWIFGGVGLKNTTLSNIHMLPVYPAEGQKRGETQMSDKFRLRERYLETESYQGPL